jgi:hypothetical protein
MNKIYDSTTVSSRILTLSNAMLLLIALGIFTSTLGIAQCNNVTWGGIIGSNQSGGVGFNPSAFLNVNSPSGGSGTLEYMWKFKSSSTGWVFEEIAEASNATYDAPALNETTTFRRCSRRSGCSGWDGESNDVTVTIAPNTCNNVTNGGTIGTNQTGCIGFDAAALTNVASPSGGSGALEFMWLYWNASTNWNMTQVSGATGLTYDPGLIQEDTYFLRCSRRQGCITYDGESNNVFIDVSTCCNATINQVAIYNLGNGTSTPLTNGAAYYVAALPANWNIDVQVSGSTAESVVFDWSGGYTNDNTQNATPFRSPDDNTALNLGAGNFSLRVKLFSTDNGGGTLCDEEVISFTIVEFDNVTNGGSIGYDQSGCVGFDPAAFANVTSPSGGSGSLEYMWLYKNASTGNQFQPVAGASQATYDAGPVFETTTFRRCSRRSNCTNWEGVTNDVVITITGDCTPMEICTITGYESLTGRLFWLPNYGADFRVSVSNGGVHFAKFSNGTAHMYGVVERISNTNHRFAIDIWFENESTYSEWIAQGKLPKDPQLGDETSWIYYDFSTTYQNTLIGQGSLAGTTLYLTNQDPDFGLQLGNGANALNSRNNGLSFWFNYTGTQNGDGDFNGTYNCAPLCALQVVAGTGGQICTPQQLTLTSSVTGASECTVPGITDCNHSISASGGYITDLQNAAICGDSAGAKLWTQSGQGSSFITIDLGSTVPAGTQICVNMKLEQCSGTSTNYSNACIQASNNSGIGTTNLVNSVMFSHTNYQEYCYTLSTPARYIKVIDNGNCSIRVDYVEYTTTGSGNSNVTHSWSGPGIVGATNGASISVNMPGTYTVAVTDCNGCTDTDDVLVTIDTQPPTFDNLPDNASVECGSLLTSFDVTASDNLDADVEVTTTFSDSGSGCNLTRTFTFVAQDDCDNKTTAIRVFSVYDNEDPTLYGVPANMTVECDEIPSAPVVTADDNCDENVSVVFEQEMTDGCPYTITRNWTATDDCGNSATATQILTVIDITNPTLHGVPADMTLECDQMAPEAVVSATDNCDEDMIISLNAATTIFDCGSTMTRTWSVTDDCGNTTSATQVITFVDTTDPIVTTGVPAELTIECDVQPPFYLPLFDDNCDDRLAVTAASGINNLHPCVYDIERSWTATDDCGNSITVYQVIHVLDTTDPELVGVPANTTVECDAIPAAADVTATDNCGHATVSFAQTATEGCPYTITRTWTATDECGNQSSSSQSILVVDTTDPFIVSSPAIQIVIECGNAIPFNAPVFDDNCDEELYITFNEVTTSGVCLPGLMRTWVATDNCGNTAQFSQYISIIDTTNPYFNNLPEDTTVECDAVPGVPVVTASDICDEAVAVSFDEQSTSGCPYTITRTWTAWDDCDNMITGVQTITVIDTQFPVLNNVPANNTLECDQPAPGYNVWASDNCDLTLSVALDEDTLYNECGFVITRIWSVTDDCGNTTTASQLINFIDTTNPYVIEGVPAELTMECNMQPPVFTPQFGDNCNMNLSVSTISGISNVDSCGYDIERSWTATDNCGNAITISQVIHVVDMTNPTLIGVPVNTTVQCNNIPAPAPVVATDNCSDPLVQFNQTSTSGCPYTITRTWTATDDCGNQSVASQVIQVIDIQNPTLEGVPADAFVECSNIPAPPVVVVNDNCDENMIVNYNQQIIPINNCTYNIVRTWSAMDDCGNEVSASQTLQVIDITMPELVGVPANATVECDEIPAIALVSGTDNCDEDVEVSFDEVISVGCPYTITRTWIAVDNCGNSASSTQVITVIDTTYPELIGVPANAMLECNQPAPDAVVTATDNCSEGLVVSLDADIEYVHCGYTLTRTWSVTDDCGNTTSATQVITFVDTTDPIVEIGVPAEFTIECDQDEPAFTPIFDDNCDEDLSVSAISGINNVSDCGYDIERSWTAIDDCGNSVSVSQVIHVVDTTDPILIGVPANTIVECNAIPDPAVVTATDNCSTPSIGMGQVVTDGCPYTITRTWTATDACGNTSTSVQIINVVDTQDPVLMNNPPVYYVIECGQELPVNNPVFSDNCDQNLEIEFSEVITSGGCPNSVIRKWIATDNCGNSIEFVQYIGIYDSTDPYVVQGVPAELTFECNEPIPSFTPSFDDSCDENLTLTAASSITNVTDCIYDIERTWSAEDDCGNVITVTQVIHVVDTTNPTLAGVPQDATYECGQDVPAPATVTATDNCEDIVEVQFTEEEFAQACGNYLVRTWRAYDNCGNQAVESQYIFVIDGTAPTVTGVPADITIECNQSIPAIVDFSATDNCDTDINLNVSDSIITGECGYQIKRYYNATDDCGNRTSVTQIITVVDTTAPVMVAPQSVTVSCDNIPATPEVTATDNCNASVLVLFNEEVEEGCPYTITRTWTAADSCGNTTVVMQYISVYDEVNPVFDAYLPYVTVECDEVDEYILTATDNCDADVEVVMIDESQVTGQCYGNLLRTYEATDNCGNSVTAFQIIDIIDSSAPVIYNVPAEATIYCGDEAPAVPADIYATDNCSMDLVVSFEQTQTNTFCPFDIIRTWTVMDDCGNAATATQVIHVEVEVEDVVVVRAFPNPAAQEFAVKFSTPTDAIVFCAIYDITGREVQPFFNGKADGGRQYNWSMNAKVFEAGTYNIKMVVNEKVYNERLIISSK